MQVEQSVSQKIIRNTIFNAIGRFWNILVALVLTPYIINHIGVERYGIWALVSVLTGYFGLLDFGIGTSFIKYISEFYAKKDYEKINQVVNTGFVFYLIFACFIITLAFFIIDPLLIVFKISAHLYNEALFVFLFGIIIFGISNVLSPFGTIQGGLQRMDITNKVAMTMSIPNIAGTIFFLESGYGLPGLMVNSAIILVITSIINVIIASRILPELKFNPFLFKKEMLKKLFSFGYKIQTSRIASMFHFHLDKLLLAYFLNIGFVAYYTVAESIVYRAREIPLMLISAILPAASELEAKTDKKSLCVLYLRSMKYVVLIGLPISLSVICLAHPFIYLWVGKEFEMSILTLRILMIGYFFNIMTGPGFHILNGMGKPEYGMKSSILATLLNSVLSILLVIEIGYFGVVIGTTISMIIAGSYFILMFHQVMNISVWEIARKILFKPSIACGIPCIIIYIAIEQIGQIGWFSLIGFWILYLVLVALIILAMDYLDEFDKTLVDRYIPVRLFKTNKV